MDYQKCCENHFFDTWTFRCGPCKIIRATSEFRCHPFKLFWGTSEFRRYPKAFFGACRESDVDRLTLNGAHRTSWPQRLNVFLARRNSDGQKKSLSVRIGNKNPETEARNANKGFSITQRCSYITPIAIPNVLKMKKVVQSFERRRMFCRFGRRLTGWTIGALKKTRIYLLEFGLIETVGLLV